MSSFRSPEVRFIERFGEAAAFASLDNDGTVGVVGIAEKGPIGTPTRITSYKEFRERFGRFINDGELGFWMERFYANSGGEGEVFVVRTAHYTDFLVATTLEAIKATLNLANDGPAFSLSGTSPAIVTAVGQTDFDIAISSGDGETTRTISLSDALVGGVAIAAAIQVAVRAESATVGGNQPDYDNFVCEFTEEGRYLLLNGTVGATKTVVVTDAAGDNTADDFNLGVANGGTEQAAPIDAIQVDAESEGIWGNALAVTVSQVNKVSTVLTEDLPIGSVSQIKVKRQAGLVTGSILEITDLTAPIQVQVFGEVDRVSGDTVFLRTPVTITDIIEGTGVTPATVRSLEFNLELTEGGEFRERFEFLSSNARNTDDYFVTKINQVSNFIRVTDLSPPTPFEFSRASVVVAPTALTSGNDGLTGLDDNDFIGSADQRNGMQAFIDTDTLNMMAIPDRPTAAVHTAMIELAESLDRFEVILDPPVGLDATGIINHVVNNQLASDFASIYWPNTIVSDPRNRTEDRTLAPTSYILGMRARNINTSGIGGGRPPGGREFQAIGVVDLEDRDSFQKTTRDDLATNRINPIAGFQGSFGFFPFGVDTLLPGGTGNGVGEVQKRFVVLKAKREIKLIMNDLLLSRVVDEETLATITALVDSYLRGIWADGLLIGRTTNEAYSVDFGLSLNPPEQMARGEVQGEVGLRLGSALKFVLITISEFVPGRNQQVA